MSHISTVSTWHSEIAVERLRLIEAIASHRKLQETPGCTASMADDAYKIVSIAERAFMEARARIMSRLGLDIV